MNRFKNSLGAAGLLIFLLNTASSGQAPTPQLTQAQAIQLAQSFCQAIGAPVTGTANAVFPAPLRHRNQQDIFWRPRWLVTFSDATGIQSDVEIVDATSSISRYFNYVLSRQALTNNHPAGTPISQATAVQQATAALQAAGMPSDIVSSPRSVNTQMTAPATSAGNLWLVTWGRQFQGVPYRREAVNVIVQAETGAVEALSENFPSPPSSSGAGSITSSQATATASAQLQTSGIQGVTFQSCQQCVVQANAFWQGGQSQSAQSNSAGQIVWDCFYTDANSRVYEVWVDAISGSVVGGQTDSPAGKMGPGRSARARTQHHTVKAGKPSHPLLKVKRAHSL